MRGKAKWIGVAALAAVLLAACKDTLPQSGLNPAGPVAQKEFNLFAIVFWIAVAVFILVEGALLLFIIKYRHKKGRPASQVHGNNRLEIGWTIAPALLLAVISVPTVVTIFQLAHKPAGHILNVNAVGHQWWWEFDYPGAKITTANELHIPVGVPVYVKLCAYGATGSSEGKPWPANGTMPVGSGPVQGEPCTDKLNPIGNAVIHSFWVPRLGGKQDVVPGHTNTVTIEATQPGVFYGQCAEYCGWSHAFMRLRVIAQSQADYDAWVVGQQQDAATAVDGSLASKGGATFGATGNSGVGCIACHSISGTSATGIGGPNLTHFAGRQCFAGCTLERTDANIARWLQNPAGVKPGSYMPNYHLSPEQINELVAYLQSLK